MHNGAIRRLEDVIDFFDKGGQSRDGFETPLVPLGLSLDEKQDLLEFLRSLTSQLPRVEQSRLPE